MEPSVYSAMASVVLLCLIVLGIKAVIMRPMQTLIGSVIIMCLYYFFTH